MKLFNASQRLNVFVLLVNLQLLVTLSLSLITDDPQKLSDWCLDSNFHKKKPGKEATLYKHCKPWQEHSCCTENVTRKGHSLLNHYKFDLNHCKKRSGRDISEKCAQHFVRDTCFFDCEPHIGLWVVKVNRSFAKERIYEAPLCASQCKTWWEDCREEYTCAYNWPRDFKWSGGKNVCPPNAECRPFKEIYQDESDFCEAVWDHSWKYTPNSEPCLRIWFKPDGNGNPNKRVAEYYLQKTFGYRITSSGSPPVSRLHLGLVALFYLVLRSVMLTS